MGLPGHECLSRVTATCDREYCNYRNLPTLGQGIIPQVCSLLTYRERVWFCALFLHECAGGRAEVAAEQVELLRIQVHAHLMARPAAGATLCDD